MRSTVFITWTPPERNKTRADILAVALNTKERAEKYIVAGNQPGESPYPLPHGESKRLTCDFDPTVLAQ